MPFFTTSDGVSLHYTDEGRGTPLLCLAGLTRSGRDFDFLAPHLEGVRLIRLDYRGRGRSEWADPAGYTVPAEACDALELLDHLSLKQTAILGTSRGGLVAMAIAATAKARLLGVALNDVGPDMSRAALERISGYVGARPAHKTYDALLSVWPDLAIGFENVPLSRFREEIVRLYKETEDGLELTYDPALGQSVSAVLKQPLPDLWPFFDALEGLPLCALRGANSNLLTRETFVKMQRHHPDMIAAEVPDRGHPPYLDEPAALTALKTWIAQL